MYPLLAAYIRRHIDAMELLLEHGADHNIKLEHKWQRHNQIQTWHRMGTLIDLAVIEECISAIKLLLKYDSRSDRDILPYRCNKQQY
jgi:ankyrin repeat protein